MNYYAYSRDWLRDMYGLMAEYNVLWTCSTDTDDAVNSYLFNSPLGGYPVISLPRSDFEERLRNGGEQFLPPVLFSPANEAGTPSANALPIPVDYVQAQGGMDSLLATLSSSRRADVRRALRKCGGLTLTYRLPTDEELRLSLGSVAAKFKSSEWASALLLSGYAIARKAVLQDYRCSVVLHFGGDYAGCMFLKPDGGYLSGVAYHFAPVSGIGTAALALYSSELDAGTLFLPGVGLNSVGDNDTAFTRYMLPVCNQSTFLHGYAICNKGRSVLPPYCELPDRVWVVSGS